MMRTILAGAICLMSYSAHASPFEISYGGRLTEMSGKPVVGPISLRATFFRSAVGNDQIPVVIPDFLNVDLKEGLFHIVMNFSPLDFHATFTGADATYIQIEDLTHGVAYPRQKFSAVPYALKVPVDGKSISFNAAGELALGNGSQILALPSTAGAPNKVLKSDGSGGLIWADDLNGGGVGSVTGAEIQDGAIGDDDISLAAGIATSKLNGAVTSIPGHGLGALATLNAVGSAEIANGSVTGTDIANATITDANVSATAGISHLKISGLGSAATKNVWSTAGDVAAGAHTHTMSAVTDAGGLAMKSVVGSAEISDGSIVNEDVGAAAAIAGTKISPDFGAQSVVTTGSVTAASFTGDGSGLSNVPIFVGMTTCPTGFTRIGASGKRGTFCMETNQRAAALWLAAKTTCNSLSLAEGVASLCTHEEWHRGCKSGLLTAMTDGHEWVAEVVDYRTSILAGQSSCTSISDGTTDNPQVFRCCIR